MLQEHAGVAGDDLAGLAPLGQAHRPGIVDQAPRRPERIRGTPDLQRLS